MALTYTIGEAKRKSLSLIDEKTDQELLAANEQPKP